MAEKQNNFEQSFAKLLKRLPEPSIRAEFQENFMSNVMTRFSSEQATPNSHAELTTQETNGEEKHVKAERVERKRLLVRSASVKRFIGWSVAAAVMVVSISSLALRTIERPHGNDVALQPSESLGKNSKGVSTPGAGPTRNGQQTAVTPGEVAMAPQSPGTGHSQSQGSWTPQSLPETASSVGEKTQTDPNVSRHDNKVGGAGLATGGDVSKLYGGSSAATARSSSRRQQTHSTVNANASSDTSQRPEGNSSSTANNANVVPKSSLNSGGIVRGALAFAAAVSNRQGMLDTDTQTSDAFFLAHYGWHTAGLGMGSMIQIPEMRTPTDSVLYPNLLYFSVTNLLSKDAGYDFGSLFGKTVEVDRIPLTESSPLDKKYQADGIVLRKESKIVGAWIDLPDGKAIGVSLHGQTLDALDNGNFEQWMQQNVAPLTPGSSNEDAANATEDSVQAGQNLLADYVSSINGGQMAGVRALFSDDFMLRRMMDGRASVLNFSLGSATSWEQMIQSITLLNVVPVLGATDADRYQLGLRSRKSQMFSVTANMSFRDQPNGNPSQKMLWVTIVQNANGDPWEIADVSIDPQS